MPGPSAHRLRTNRNQLAVGDQLVRDLHQRFTSDPDEPFHGTITVVYRYQGSVINSVSGTFAGDVAPRPCTPAAAAVLPHVA